MNYIDVQTARRNAEMIKQAGWLSNRFNTAGDTITAGMQMLNPVSTMSYAGKRVGHAISDLWNGRYKDALLGRKTDGWTQHLIDRGNLSKDTMLKYNPLLNGARGAISSLNKDYGNAGIGSILKSSIGIGPNKAPRASAGLGAPDGRGFSDPRGVYMPTPSFGRPELPVLSGMLR